MTEARARTGAWITALSPALAGPLAAWLRASTGAASPEAAAVARHLLQRLP